MRAARNYTIGEGTPPVEPGTEVITLTINMSGVTTPVLDFARMKYNKKSGVMMVKDDGAIEDYTVGYAYLKGGIQAKDGQTYPGVTYTDGAGKTLNYKLTSAINTNSDANNPANGRATWPNRIEMLETIGWELANHSYDHGNFDRYWDIKAAEKVIWDQTGFRTRAMVVPTNDEGYATTSLYLGYTIVGTAGAFDDFEDHRFTQDGYGIYWGGYLDTRDFDYKKLLFNRYYAGEGGANDLADMYTLVDAAFLAAKNNTANRMVHWFHHGLEDNGGGGAFTYWKALIQYIKNHPDNNDTLWVTGMQEFTEYYETKDLVVKEQVRTGNVLTVTLDLGAIPSENRLRDMSLLLTGATISSVQVQGADSFTFNAATGLINLYSKNQLVTSPYEDPVLPKIVGAVRTGSGIQLTFSKAITQSQFSNSKGAAYSVENNTITNITGSGTTWMINCGSVVNPGTRFSYRMQRGNAQSSDGLKVPTYINYPTTG